MIWKTKTHQFTATICQHTGRTCPALARVARALATSMSNAASATTADLEIEGSVELAHCATGCTARFRAHQDEVRLFCGVDPETDTNRLDVYADLMFGTEFGPMPSGMLADQPCAMLQAEALVPRDATRQEVSGAARPYSVRPLT